ncbi:MAG: Manganese transport system membrane protein MntB [Fimbriimonadaceae bacterium]|nr:Manganese transport system membrane protein MntB [Fimbriimonadaceae bacterium]
MITFWTVATALLAAVLCANLGVWLVLQRQSLTADAISHSVLPGLVVAFLLFGSRNPLPMIVGAAAAGLATVFLTRLIRDLLGVKEDAGLGIVFSVLFALGVILITRYASQVDLDPGCVLYGLVEFVALDTIPVAGVEIPRALLNILPAAGIAAVVLWVARRELAVMAFDPMLAATLGKRPGMLYYVLMAVIAIATVACFEAVGSILVIAMLIGPAAIAQLLTVRLSSMFAVSTAVGVVCAVAGYFSATALNTSVAGMMSVWVGILYIAAAAATKLRYRNVGKSGAQAGQLSRT